MLIKSPFLFKPNIFQAQRSLLSVILCRTTGAVTGLHYKIYLDFTYIYEVTIITIL